MLRMQSQIESRGVYQCQINTIHLPKTASVRQCLCKADPEAAYHQLQGLGPDVISLVRSFYLNTSLVLNLLEHYTVSDVELGFQSFPCGSLDPIKIYQISK